MTIYDGKDSKISSLTPAKPNVDHESPLWYEFEPKEGSLQPILIVDKALCFKNYIEDDTIRIFICNSPSVTQPTFQLLDSIMNKHDQEIIVDDFTSELIPVVLSHKSVPIEIEPGKTLNINPKLSPSSNKMDGSVAARTQRGLCVGLHRYEGNSP
jgi:hypothetical protein